MNQKEDINIQSPKRIENEKEEQIPCYIHIIDSEEIVYLKNILLKACKFLTNEQYESLGIL